MVFSLEVCQNLEEIVLAFWHLTFISCIYI